MTHTKGPWHLLSARTLINIKGPNGEQICQVPVRDKGNAVLMAIGPEMLEALEEIVVSFESANCNPFQRGKTRANIDIAKKIISKIKRGE